MTTPVHDRLEEAGTVDRIGPDHFHPTVRTAAPVRASTDGGA